MTYFRKKREERKHLSVSGVFQMLYLKITNSAKRLILKVKCFELFVPFCIKKFLTIVWEFIILCIKI